ncbi:MAG: IPT/TIG domain-containing protein [Thermoanaerobaculia bacterium]
MRRIAIALTLAAAVVGLHACAADAPSAPRPGPGGGTSALQIQLFTNDANPKAGTCTLIEAIVTLNGSPVPEGTGVSFSSDFGTFSQSGLPLVSVVTQSGTAVTALCGPGAGTARVRASATVGTNTGSANLTVVFQASAGTLPFVSNCSPSFGGKEGGTVLTLNGGRFFGTPATTRAQFTVNGATKDGIVQSVSASQVVILTPGFPEFSAPQLLAAITLSFGTNLPQPVVLSLPSCFAFGTADSGTPTIASILPSSGTNEGNTRVTIVGSGFSSSGVQVFFGTVEATVVSVSFNQIVVLSPPAFGAGAPNLNKTVPVTVKNIASGVVSNPVDFRYTPAVQLTAISNNQQRVDGTLSPVTIYGQGFQAPVAVTLAGIPATIQSVSATEIIVVPTNPLVTGCADISGVVSVTNIDTGDTASGLSFIYLVSQTKPVITNIANTNPDPALNGQPKGFAGDTVTISGANFSGSVEVKFGTHTSPSVTVVGPGQLSVKVPPGTVTTPPACTAGNPGGTLQNVETVDVTVTNRDTGCSATATQAWTYVLGCVAPTP